MKVYSIQPVCQVSLDLHVFIFYPCYSVFSTLFFYMTWQYATIWNIPRGMCSLIQGYLDCIPVGNYNNTAIITSMYTFDMNIFLKTQSHFVIPDGLKLCRWGGFYTYRGLPASVSLLSAGIKYICTGLSFWAGD